VTKFITTQAEYTLGSRRIAGTREEKLEQLDDAIQELLDIRVLESAADRPNVRFIAAPRPKPHRPALFAVILGLLVLLVWMLGARPAHAQSAADPPVGKPQSVSPDQPIPPPGGTDEAIWSNVKFGATFEGYYQFNWNKPFDRIIPLRAYDTRSNSFSIQQAALIVDAAPDVEKGRRAGLRVDLQFGQATEALQGSAANEPRPDVYRHVWQAFGTFVFPVGRGLQADFGKFASNLGYETNYAKDDFNFSRAYLFNFLPYYHTGVRTTLPVSDKVTLMYMLTNGIQQTEDFNNFKSSQVSAIVKPVGAVTWTTSYYAGQEQPDNGAPNGPNGWFRVFDTNGTVTATPALTLAFDLTHVSNQARAADPSLTLFGVGGYARYQTTTSSALALRYERLRDDGLFGGITQTLQEVTLTAEHKLGEGFLARAEFRRDFSNQPFFPGRGASRGHQNTALAGLVWWIGNKTGPW
jgi:hypothetical protein